VISLFLLLLGALTASGASISQQSPAPPVVPNPGFELVDPSSGFAAGWHRGVSEGTQGSAEIDTEVAHSGARSLRITNATPYQAYRYVLVNTDWLETQPATTWILRFHARGRGVGRCNSGIAFDGGGEHRQPMPAGDYEWRAVSMRFTVPDGCTRFHIQFASDDVTGGLWIDDVSLEYSPVQLANIAEMRPAKEPRSWYPRTERPLPRRLVVLDVSAESADVCGAMAALQGIVNRRSPRLYLINPTNPAGYDEKWLAYLKQKGYTGQEERLKSPEAALKRFRNEVRGAIVWDPQLPGSRHAAWMLAPSAAVCRFRLRWPPALACPSWKTCADGGSAMQMPIALSLIGIGRR